MSGLVSSAGRVLRRDIGRVLAISLMVLPVGVALSTCLLGLPILAWGLRKLTEAMLLSAKAEHGDPAPIADERSWAGPLALIGLVVLGSAVGGATSVLLHWLDPSVSDLPRAAIGLGGALALSVAIGTMLGPFLFAPLVAADGTKGVLTPITRSFEIAARIGPRETAALGAMVGAVMGASVLGFLGLFLLGGGSGADPTGPMLIAAPFAIAPGPALVLALVAERYARARRADAADDGREVALTPRIKGVLGLLAPVVALFVASVVIAAATPLPMRELGDSSFEIRRGFEMPVESLTLPVGDRTVVVRAADHGVVVEAADGGGAGAIAAGFDTAPETGAVLTVTPSSESPGAFEIAITDREHRAVTVVDADGVRLDDSSSDRVIDRLGVVGALAAALGFALLLVLGFFTSAEVGAARTLEAPRLLDPVDPRAPRGLGKKALEGVLRVAEGSRLLYRPPNALRRALGAGTGGGILRVEGEAWIEADAGALRFRLPDSGIPVAGAGPSAELSGREVVILSRFSDVSPSGLRTSSTPLPSDAQLVMGHRADAATALVDRAARRASWLAAPTLVALGLASLAILLTL